MAQRNDGSFDFTPNKTSPQEAKKASPYAGGARKQQKAYAYEQAAKYMSGEPMPGFTGRDRQEAMGAAAQAYANAVGDMDLGQLAFATGNRGTFAEGLRRLGDPSDTVAQAGRDFNTLRAQAEKGREAAILQMLGAAGSASAQQAAAARQTVEDIGTYEAQFQDLGAAMQESGVPGFEGEYFTPREDPMNVIMMAPVEGNK